MKTYLDCLPCFVRQALDAARMVTDEPAVQEQVLRQVLAELGRIDLSWKPPQMGQRIHRLVRDVVGFEDPYHDVKRRFNNAALKIYSRMRQRVIESENPLEAAIQLAIAGNIIDFGVNGTLRDGDLEQTISECLDANFTGFQLEAFGQAVNNAEEILYIADNAGEIVFDRLLIEQLPIEKVTVAVKGAPVINDATMEDAVLAGLPQIVEVIDNGSDAPGVILESCSQSFRDRFDKADLIIAKGQGNYETLSDVDKNIFFMLKAKCPVIARHIGCATGTNLLFRKNPISITGKF
jgi:uncharacterized protein with ATP-grasp and redox domains